MLFYSEVDLLSDAALMTSTSSSGDFGLPVRAESSSHVNSSDLHDADHVYSAVQQHSDCIRFLTFAEKSMSVEAHKSTAYSSAMSTTQSNRQKEGRGKTSCVEFLGHERGEYCNRSMKDIISHLPVSLSVTEINSSSGDRKITPTTSSERISLKQLRRDVERDTFKVNGTLLIGSEKGLEGVCTAIIQCCNRVLSQCCLQPMDKIYENDIAREVLSKASRTHCGGIAYQCLQYMINLDDVIVVPLSALAKPLNINIEVSSFNDATLSSSEVDNKWGLVCNVECSTYFTLKCNDSLNGSESPLESPLENIEADKLNDVTLQLRYEDAISIPVNPRSKFSIETLVGMSGVSSNSGKVTALVLK